MRTARNCEIFRNDAGEFIGLLLGADFTAEHEWGIHFIQRDFGLTENLSTIASLTNTRPLDEDRYSCFNLPVKCYDQTASTKVQVAASGFFTVRPGYTAETITKKGVNKFLETTSISYISTQDVANGIVGAWDRGSFGFLLFSPDREEIIRDLVIAMNEHDLCLIYGDTDLSRNFGLNLFIASRLPKNFAFTDKS